MHAHSLLPPWIQRFPKRTAIYTHDHLNNLERLWSAEVAMQSGNLAYKSSPFYDPAKSTRNQGEEDGFGALESEAVLVLTERRKIRQFTIWSFWVIGRDYTYYLHASMAPVHKGIGICFFMQNIRLFNFPTAYIGGDMKGIEVWKSQRFLVLARTLPPSRHPPHTLRSSSPYQISPFSRKYTQERESA